MDNIKTLEKHFGKENSQVTMLRDRQQAANSMSQAADAAPAAAKRQTLSGLVGRVENMQGSLFTGRTWNRLMRVYASAKKIELSGTDDIRVLRRAVRELMRALTALEPAKRAEEDDETREGLPVVVQLGSGDAKAAGSATVQAAAIAEGGAVDASV